VTQPSYPELLLQSYGITEPEDIDLEAIAWEVGVIDIKFRRLDGCEARIVGVGNNAIISVSNAVQRQRQRFSICHELGHWHHHRGRSLCCRAEDIGSRQNSRMLEQVANDFASDLLLPSYLLLPIGRKYRQITIKAMKYISERFGASLSATALKLIKERHSPTMAVRHKKHGDRWFVRSPDVPDRWFPREDLDKDTYAYAILHGEIDEQPAPRKMPAEAWFDRPEADRYEIQEQSFKVAQDEILTILTLSNDEMLLDWGARKAGRF